MHMRPGTADTVKVAGGLTGQEVHKGELQRYLASMVLCPTMLLNHSPLECRAVGPSTLRLYDQLDPEIFVELDVSEQRCPAHVVRMVHALSVSRCLRRNGPPRAGFFAKRRNAGAAQTQSGVATAGRRISISSLK